MKRILLPTLAFLGLSATAQLTVQSGATFFIDAGAVVTVQGDVTSNANITGTGKLLMKGTALQNLNMNGFTIPNLEIDNTNHVALGGASNVSGVLTFTNGKLQLGNHNFILAATGSYAGAATGKFAETNGTGEFRKEVTAVGEYILPVGNGTDYTPVKYTIAGSTFSSAYVGGRSVGTAHPAKHIRSSDFLTTYWALSRSGVTGGTVTTMGTYASGDVTGTEDPFVKSMTYDGANWALGTAEDYTNNTVSANMAGNSGDLYGMNKFILNVPKVFLQGAFNAATGTMNDNLRTAPALIPLSDPYRGAPYNTAFTHVNNSVAETINAAVLNNQANANNDIVDWVFVELRTISSPTQAPVAQTRSALVQRDGDVVDIDGTSPVYFKNVDAGNYAIAVRHRNHLGMSSNPASPIALGLASSTYDFTSAAAGGIFGTLNTNYTQGGAPLKNLMYAGNANFNAQSNYSVLGNDRIYLLNTVLGGVSTGSVAGYSAGDMNMNRTANYSVLGNDRLFLLNTVLGGNSTISKSQALPN